MFNNGNIESIVGVVVAGGKATRMGDLAFNIPKALLTIKDKPLLDYQLDLMERHGIREIYIIAHVMADKIEDHLKKSTRLGSVKIITEPKLLGSGGGLRYLPEADKYLILFGDIAVDMNLSKFIEFHKKKRADVSVVIQRNSHPFESDLMQISDSNECVRMYCKPHKELLPQNSNLFMVAGVFLFEKQILTVLKNTSKNRPIDLVKDFIAKMICNEYKVYGYSTSEYLNDMGTPERYKAINHEWRGCFEK